MHRLAPLVVVVHLLGIAACGDNTEGARAPTLSVLGAPRAVAEDGVLGLELALEDPDGDDVVVTATAAHGTLAGSGTSWRYTPPADFHGSELVRFTASDGALTTHASLRLEVTPHNDRPRAGDEAFAADEDTALSLPASALLANDTDVDRDRLRVVAVAAATTGTVTLAGDVVTFTPPPDFNGPASFTYTVSDGAEQATGTVVVTVGGVNDAPVAVADVLATAEDAALTIMAAMLAANDTDVDGHTLAVTAVAAPSAGTVALDDGRVVYTPPANFHGIATFAYAVTDGAETRDGTVSVIVAPVNDLPVATADTRGGDEDAALVIALGELLVNDTDVDGDTLGVSAVGNAAHGTVVLDGSDVRFTPAANYHGPASFEYTLTDGAVATTGTVSLVIAPVNDAPIAGDDAGATAEDSPLWFARATLLANDDDVDGDPLQLAVTQTVGGTASASGEGVTFTPAPNFHGTAGFTYTLDDGHATASAHVTITVTAVRECGDGEQEGAETCDDGNTTSGDGCSASCDLEPAGYATVAPVRVNGTRTCTVATANTGRKVAADALGNVHAVMTCDGDAFVATSTDFGATFAAPAALGIAAVSELAVHASTDGVAHVAAVAGGELRYTRTEDGGASWAAPVTLGTAGDAEVSIAAAGASVWIATGGATGIAVFRNTEHGTGTWSAVDVAMPQAFFDVLVDERGGDVVLASDTPELHLRTSDDGGATWTAEVNPPAQAFYSDYALGAGRLFVVGSSGTDDLAVVDLAQPATVTTYTGLPAGSAQRTVAADAAGHAYVASTTSTGGVQLDHLASGSSALAPARVLAPVGAQPGLCALPDAVGAAVVFADGAGAVYVTVQTF